MAYTETTFYLLRKCAKGDYNWHVPVNWNMDTIDAAIHSVASDVSTMSGVVGDPDDLETTDKSTLVAAINEVFGMAGPAGDIGDLGTLTTDEDGSVVGAINEVDGHADDAQSAADAAQETADRKGYKKFTASASVGVTVDDTFVGNGYAVAIPADTILKGFLIKVGAPSGTAGGTKTVQISMGSVVNADEDLTDPTDIDIMVASGDQIGAFVHGDQAGDHEADYFTADFNSAYFAAPTSVYLNFIGKASDATANPGTVAAAVTVYALMEQLA